ncbi:MAG: exodeoxyribonuclease VII small subunit [Phycisphaerales bacterium]|jgi:exodeoxyribonuclease VII small subunit
MKKPPRTPAADAAPLDPQVAAMGYEEAIEELEAIIGRMEKGETTLEESLREYARGDALVRRCRQVLDQAEQRIESIAGQAMAGGELPHAEEPPF